MLWAISAENWAHSALLSHLRPVVKSCLKIQFYLCGAGAALVHRSVAQSHRHLNLHEQFYSFLHTVFPQPSYSKGSEFCCFSLCLLQLHLSTSLLQAPFRVTNCAPILLAQRKTWELLPGDSQAVTSVIQVFCTQINAKFEEWDLNLRFILVQICHNSCSPVHSEHVLVSLMWKFSGTTKTPRGCPANHTQTKNSVVRSVCSGGNLHSYSLTTT